MAEASPFVQGSPFANIPSGSFYADPDNLLSNCICAFGQFCFLHVSLTQTSPDIDFAAAIVNHPDFPRDSSENNVAPQDIFFEPGPSTLNVPASPVQAPFYVSTSPVPSPLFVPTVAARPAPPAMPSPLEAGNVQQLEEEADTIQPADIHSWIRDTYNAPDRTDPPAGVRSSPPRRNRSKRKEKGFRCSHSDCSGRPDSMFDRLCDLRRHEKNHLSIRPHPCKDCDQSFLYPKDLRRHRGTVHSHGNRFRCPVSDCIYAEKGFSREDNLRRHMKSKHKMGQASSP